MLLLSWYTTYVGRRSISSKEKAAALWLVGIILVMCSLMLVAACG